MNNDNMVYEPPFRPPFEFMAAKAWGVAAVSTIGITWATGFPLVPGLVAAGVAAGLGYWRWEQARPYYRARENLKNASALWFIKPDTAAKWYKWAQERDSIWIGKGYEITPQSAEKIKFIRGRGLSESVGIHVNSNDHKSAWIQHVESQVPITLGLPDTSGHILILGSTRTGKTRCFDHLLSQAIMRGEPVIVLDPKGDKDLEEIMRNAYKRAGRSEDFCAFRPADKENSVRLDPLASWQRPTEIASRVAALVEADGTFLAFVWRVLNNLVQGEILVNRKPNLLSLRRLVERGVDGLLLEVLKSYCEKNATPNEYVGYVNNAKTKKSKEVDGYIDFYENTLSRRAPHLAIEGLISDYRHDKEHFSKMIVTLTPILSMLTTDPLDDLLSPTPGKGSGGEIVTLEKIVKQNRGLYVALSSMSDPTVGSAIGSILLADLAALAGERYDSGEVGKPITLLGDEIAELSNQQLTQILNKGAGAKIRVIAATQTLADLEVRLKGKAPALQQIGNLNNIIIFRLKDPDTAKLVASGFPTYQSRSIERRYSQSIQPSPNDVYGGSYTEGLKEDEEDMVSPDMLMSLPPLHYIGQFADGRIMKGQIPIVGEFKK